MTRDDIIRMAREAWGDSDPSVESPAWVYTMERFAALVAAAKEAEYQGRLEWQQRSYEREIQIEVEAEREECAVAGAAAAMAGQDYMGIAAAIRTRKN